MRHSKADFGAIVLAGGKSRRMGQEKGLVELCGLPMLQWVIQAVQPLVSEIVIVANAPEYADFGHRVVPDAFPDTGPLGGLCTGLQALQRPWAFVLSCDIPLIQTATLRALQQGMDGKPCVAANSQAGNEPLISIFSPSSLPQLKEILQAGKLRMEAAITTLGGVFLPLELIQADFDPASLANFNTMEEVLAFDCQQRPREKSTDSST